MEEKKYYLGLDIGTDSVGWCVTDQYYNIIKKHKTIIDRQKRDDKGHHEKKFYGNHLWGSRLFDEASDASERRLARETRRRYQRRRYRIVLLQSLFQDERNKVDPYFFDRLNNSAIHLEDRADSLRCKHLLFNGADFTDRDFYHQYPTIYHLRLDRIEHPEKKFDIREVYLALAHRIKYRGNFLQDGERKEIDNDPDTLKGLFDELDGIIGKINEDSETEDREPIDPFNCDEKIAKEILEKFKSLNRIGDTKDALVAAFKLTALKSTNIKRKRLDLIAGSTYSASKFFTDINWEDCSEDAAKAKIDFSSEKFFEKTLPETLSPVIGDDYASLLKKLKDLYSLRILAGILKGESKVSKARVSIYETHKNQLAILKDLIKRYNPAKYNAFFRKNAQRKEKVPTVTGKGDNQKIEYKEKVLSNYAQYIGFNNVNNKKERFAHTGSADDLYALIGALLPLNAAEKEDFIEKQPGDRQKFLDIKKAIDDKTYLPRQNSKENGVLPYQLNLNERRTILANQGQYYPFLLEEATDFANSEKKCSKIESILKYKIPYFVGPLSEKATNHWIVRKAEGKIDPWNFHDLVDEEKTADGFMKNLKNCCTYLMNEPTLPKQSLIYQRYILLNERNNWRINDEPIKTEDKEYLIKELYLKQKTVKKKNVEEALTCKYKTKVTLSTSGTKEDKGVTNEDFHASLSSWMAFRDDRAFGVSLLHDKNKIDTAENIIYDITTFEDKSVRQKRLKKYNLTPSQIKYISGLKFKDWGRLSGKLLNGLTTDLVNESTGEVLPYTILDLRWYTDQNFMEILTTKNGKDYKYDFRNRVEKAKAESQETTEDVIDGLYTNPKRKRALYQTLDIIKELKEVLKIDHFNTYFVESTRSEGDKKRTKSRKAKIQDRYKEGVAKYKEEVETAHLRNELDAEEESALNGKKLYLYFRQMGKSVYTGKAIDLNNLDKDYDIDHIIPQAKVKDDSFRNTVLVEKTVNNLKQDKYPIPFNTILTKEGQQWVKFLNQFNSALMPKEKRNRILRTKALSDEEVAGFVNRQLVVTNQSVKAVCEVLKAIDKDSKIVYSRANYVSDFRKIFDIPKSREANDFHHAHDAYLNIVVGNVYNKVFSSGDTSTYNIVKYKREHREGRNRDPEYIFKRDQRRMFTDSLVWKAKHYVDDKRTEEDPSSNGTIDLVRKYLSYQDPRVTQRRKVNVGKQGFFNQISLHTAKEGGASFPLKTKGPFAQKGYETKYGGYSDLTNPYTRLVRSEGKKGKHIYSIEFVPAIYLTAYKGDQKQILKYLSENNGLKNPEILLDKLLRKTILQIPYTAENGKEGYVRLGISGKSGNTIICINRSELRRPKEYRAITKKISKLLGLNNPAGKKIDVDTIYKDLGRNDVTKNGKVVLARDELKKLYDYRVKDVFCRPEYEGLPKVSTTISKIKVSTRFSSISTLEQRKCLATLNKIVSCKSTQGNSLKELGNELPSSFGGIQINQKLSLNIQIRQTSVTGLTEKILFTVPED